MICTCYILEGISVNILLQSISQTREKMLVLDTPVNSIFFAQITGYIYVDYLFKCYTQLRYAENSTTCAPLRVPQNSRKKTRSSIPINQVIPFRLFFFGNQCMCLFYVLSDRKMITIHVKTTCCEIRKKGGGVILIYYFKLFTC